MTKIYIYCLFDGSDVFHGVYSSTQAVHRDAIKICNKNVGQPLMEVNGKLDSPSLTKLRNLFKGAYDVQVRYFGANRLGAKIVKTKLKE